jgi:hypothetical protein
MFSGSGVQGSGSGFQFVVPSSVFALRGSMDHKLTHGVRTVNTELTNPELGTGTMTSEH